MKNLSQFTLFSLDLAKKSGEILMDYYAKKDVDFERKGYNDVATAADKESEKAIIEEIDKRFPEHSILAEESGATQKGAKYRWIIDPLDGTSNFKHKVPIFCVSIALEIDEEIHCGIVYNPAINELFVAEAGKGAYFNDSRISVSDADQSEFSLFATGFIPYPGVLEKNLKVFEHFMKTGHLVRRFGSAAIDLAYTACGRFDGFWEFNLNPWDIAAGMLLVEEAGGRVTDALGGKMTFESDSIVASNGKMHEKMLKLIQEVE